MKFYKITNEKECHHGLQYHDGLNEDIVPFNPSGDCETGGIYFAREDILSFLIYGPWIREVTLPEDAQIYKNPLSPVKWKADKVILGKRREINPETIQELIDEGADVHSDKDAAFRWACSYGHLEIAKLLLKNGAYIEAKSNYSLCFACHNGHLEIVKFLVENGADVRIQNNYPMVLAANNEHFEIMKYLFENGANINGFSGEPLQYSVKNNNIEIVTFIMENLKEYHEDQIEYAIYLASIFKHNEIKQYIKTKMENKK